MALSMRGMYIVMFAGTDRQEAVDKTITKQTTESVHPLPVYQAPKPEISFQKETNIYTDNTLSIARI
jgi:hypothetical protein